MCDQSKKYIFRTTMFEKRENLLEKSFDIIEESFALLPDKGAVAFYRPIKNEPCLRVLWEKAWDKGLCVLFPKVVSETEMVFCPTLSYKDFDVGMWGILEPNTKPFHDRIDMAFVPGICFGEDGSRLGYGAGYYDRFFAEKKSYLVGVCWEDMITDDIPVESQDVFMDAVLTNHRLIIQ